MLSGQMHLTLIAQFSYCGSTSNRPSDDKTFVAILFSFLKAILGISVLHKCNFSAFVVGVVIDRKADINAFSI